MIHYNGRNEEQQKIINKKISQSLLYPKHLKIVECLNQGMAQRAICKLLNVSFSTIQYTKKYYKDQLIKK